MALAQLSDLALDHYSDRQKLVIAAQHVAEQMWSEIDPRNLVESWAERVPELTAVVSGAQLGAARPAAAYTDEALQAEDTPPAAVADPNPAGFSGQTADGRGLVSLLSNPVFVTLATISDGFDVISAMNHGRATLGRAVATEVADAGRLADQVAITSRKGARGYIRMAVGNSCARCLLLAGREYRWSAGFQRHPKCDCIHIPAGIGKAGLRSLMPDPEAMYARMTPLERARAGFTRADQRAIADGSDIAQVVNAHRGMYVTGGRKLTSESTTRRGVVKRRQRLSVDECYRVAGEDRDEALALLRDNGYLFDGGPKLVEPPIQLPVAVTDPALRMSATDLKAIARQNNVPIAGLTRKPDIVARLREFEAGHGRLSGLPEFAEQAAPAVTVAPIKAPTADPMKSVSGQGAGGWLDAIPATVPVGGLRVRNLDMFPTGASDSYVVKHGTVFRDPDGVAYLIEHEADEYGSAKVARALAELRAAHAGIPAAARANKAYSYLQRENPLDASYFRQHYNNPTHESYATAGGGVVNLWVRQKFPRVSIPELRHETGHNLDHLVGPSSKGSKSKGWADAADADAKTVPKIEEFDSRGRITRELDRSRPWPGGVTDYGKSSAGEDYAESVMLYQLGVIARGRVPGESAVRDLYFRDIFPERAKILDREFPEIAAEQKAAIEALKGTPVRSLAEARREFARLSAEATKGRAALKVPPLRVTQPGTKYEFEGFDALGASATRAQKALVQYLRGGFTAINSILRTGRMTDIGPKWWTEAEIRGFIDVIRQAFDASRLRSPVVLYRGAGTGRGTFGDPSTWPDDLAGREWVDEGVFSASTSRAVADEFGQVQMRIVVPQGHRAITLSGGGAQLESEIALAPGTRFRVVKDRGVDAKGKRQLDVEVVPEGTPPGPVATVAATAVAKPPPPPKVEATPEHLRDLLAGKGTAPKTPTTGPLAQGYGSASIEELRVIAASRLGHLGKVAPKATRDQLLAAIRADSDLADGNVFTREVARLTQLRVERGQALADLLAEAAELTFKRATPQLTERTLRAVAARVASDQTPVPPAFLSAVLRAVQAGDRTKVEAALRRLGEKHKIRLDGMAGDITKTREGMEAVAGGGVKSGVEVRVTRPGALLTLPSGDIARLRTTVVREVDAQERAIIRQEAIDEARKRAEVLTEVAQLVQDGASKAVLKERLGIAMKRLGIEGDADLKALIRAVETGDSAKIATASKSAAKKLNLTQVDTPGALGSFDPKQFKPIGGQIAQGAPVRVVRPGFEFALKGEKITLSKPVVEELTDAELAQLRQEAVDTARALVELSTEGGPAQRRIAIEASALPDDVKAVLLAASKVSPAKLKTTLTTQLKKRGVTVAKVPKTPVKFDPKTMEVKGGAKLPVGTKVRVVEPEVTGTHLGETVVVRKAVVDPVAASKIDALPRTKVAPPAQAAKATNPNYGTARNGPTYRAAADAGERWNPSMGPPPFGAFEENCSNVVYAFEMRMRGFDVHAAPLDVLDRYGYAAGRTYAEMDQLLASAWRLPDGRPHGRSLSGQRWRSFAEIDEEIAQTWPEGARGMIFVGRHIFNVVKVRGKAQYIEAQLDVSTSQNVTRLYKAKYRGARGWGDIQEAKLVRLDDLAPTDGILEAVKAVE